MKKPVVALMAALAFAGLCGLGAWHSMKRSKNVPVATPPTPLSEAPRPTIADASRTLPEQRTAAQPAARRGSTGLSVAEKAAKVEKIKHDYDEMRAKWSTEYSQASASSPGGLNGFMRQLALLEREKHADLAAVLDARELEDLEMRETNAGQTVQRLLGDTSATEEQRRAIFRLQLAFEDRFALTFDVSPPALYEREKARQALQTEISGLLTQEQFGSWLRAEGGDYTNFAAFVAQQALPPGTALELWRARNEFRLQQLALRAQPRLVGELLRAADTALAHDVREQVLGILGPGAMQAAGPAVLGWMPPEK